MKEQRKLAAIMFTDIVGYTALMSKDEQHALRILQKSRDLLKSFIKQFNGEWLQAIGDGTLSSFASVVDAVNCALEVQRSLKSDPELSLRIGIHIGDVISGEGEIYGDGVNVASRLETLAEPGGICISGQVYSEIRNKPDIEAVFLGEKTLKNVDLPMKVYALTVEEPPGAVAESYPVERPSAAKPEPSRKRTYLYAGAAIILIFLIASGLYFFTRPSEKIDSLAVLPLENLTGDPEQEYFVDGMTEALIAELGKIGALRVISRTSVMQYKKVSKPLPEIARELNVDALVEGSVMRAGDKVRITAQLIGAVPERHLWAEDYERDLREILTLQKEVARAIAREIKVTLTPQEDARLVSKQIVNPEAHEAYLLGRHYYSKGLEADWEAAIEYFERALEIDSTYALAYAGLADVYTFMGTSHARSPEDTWSKARAAAEKALAIDEGLAEAHTSLAKVKEIYEYDWAGAEREFKRALEINPNSSDAILWYAWLLMFMERHNEAIAQIERALELDPHSILVQMFAGGFIMNHAGRYEEAIRLSENIIDSDPDHPFGYWCIAYVYASQGMYEEAIAPLRTTMALLGADVNDELGFLGYLYGRLGRKAEALKQLEALDELAAKGRYVSPLNRSWVYIGLDDKDQAFAWLEKGYERRAGWMPFLNVQFFYDSLRDDPRFEDLLKKMGLDK